MNPLQSKNSNIVGEIPKLEIMNIHMWSSHVSTEGRENLRGERTKVPPRGNTFILHISMLSKGHISSGINFCHIYIHSTVGWYGWRADQLIWSVILYSCEIKRTGRDYNRHRKNRKLQKWRRWKPTEIISPAPATCTEESIFGGQLVQIFLRGGEGGGSLLSWDSAREHSTHTLCRGIINGIAGDAMHW